jgi:IS30 family transposase
MKKRNEVKWKHLTENDRARISHLLDEGLRFSKIGKILGKDPSTISKEVRARRYKKPGAKTPSHPCMIAKACRRRGVCSDLLGTCSRLCVGCPWCKKRCDEFAPYPKECCREEKAPYVCNGCEKHLHGQCRYRDKYLYGAFSAHKQYRRLLSESRQGADRTEDEMLAIEELCKPLILKGQPLSHVYAHHKDEISISQRSFYRYVNGGFIGLMNIDMRRVVRYKKRKRRTDPKPIPYMKMGYTYDCFLRFLEENPDTRIAEMDIVEGKRADKKKLLTIMPRDLRLMIIILLERKTIGNAIEAIDGIQSAAGDDGKIFAALFPAILTDNDAAFANPKRFEADADGVVRTQLFYCEPNRSDQKGALEKNHEYIRYIIPKGKTFNELTKENVRDIMNHINSTARPELGDKSPLELALREFGDKTLAKLGMELIPPDEVCLTPQLIKPAMPE